MQTGISVKKNKKKKKKTHKKSRTTNSVVLEDPDGMARTIYLIRIYTIFAHAPVLVGQTERVKSIKLAFLFTREDAKWIRCCWMYYVSKGWLIPF